MEKKVNKNLLAVISTASVAFLGFLAIMILVLCDYNFKIDKFNVVVAENRVLGLPITVSPGSSKAKKTAKFAFAPLCG